MLTIHDEIGRILHEEEHMGIRQLDEKRRCICAMKYHYDMETNTVCIILLLEFPTILNLYRPQCVGISTYNKMNNLRLMLLGWLMHCSYTMTRNTSPKHGV